MIKKIGVNNYGEVLSKGMNMNLVSYKTYGDYQGDYIAVLQKENIFFIYKGYFGSCSGCDWLERECDWADTKYKWGNNYAEFSYYLTEDQIKNYCSEEKPFLELTADQMEKIVNSKNPEQYFPANTRNSYDDFNFEDIKKQLKDLIKNNDKKINK